MRKIGNQLTARLLHILQVEITFLVSLILMALIVNYIAFPIQVDGKSMDPTLHDKDFGFASVISLHTEELERFDVVIVKVDQEYWVKRIIALPNETIRCENNEIYVNGKLIDQTFLDQTYVLDEIKEHHVFTGDFDEIQLKDDEVFLMGDNRVHSLDSRIMGPFKLEQIHAKDLYIVWPFNHWRVVK